MKKIDVHKSRDAAAAEAVSMMADLKYFDEQFIYYTTAYVEKQTIKYRLHENADKMYSFFINSPQRGLYPVEITQHGYFKKVPSGKESEVAVEVQNNTLNNLKNMYPKELFRFLDALGKLSPNDSAAKIMRKWQEELELCFIEEKINLFWGELQAVQAAKLLTEDTFFTLKEWVEDRKAQIAKHENVPWHRKHTIHGFMYWENGVKKVYVNAQYSLAMQRLCEIKEQGAYCTPLFTKKYWLDSKSERKLLEWREVFKNDLLEAMDDSYLNYLKEIHQLPSVIDSMAFKEMTQAIDTDKYPSAKQVLNYYKTVLNIR